MNQLEFLVRDLPSPEAARRFYSQFSERHPSHTARLNKNEGLLSDILTIVSFSPLLETTILQNPEYAGWLARKRKESSVRGKDELLESLARFALTNSQVEPNVLLARFRRRELLRIFLRDIRRLGTIAEITEEISNLADAILEHSVRLARQEMNNRYGSPFETGENGRKQPSEVCVVSLGKLGSKELNYSSDIDLLFIYSADGLTSGSGEREPVTNREYFAKFAETVTQLVGRQSGEGAAYRVDMRLRPHGRVGALALSLNETVRYYVNDARNWERQVLIRSRASAGNASLFKEFFSRVETVVFAAGRNVDEALREVNRSKEQIDHARRGEGSFDVKLGRGGIREIEFIAQALQLAHGGLDRWLRVPHTLISISRLADRHYLTEDERSKLSSAYDFLRRLEHVLQMEHGLQTHSLPTDLEKRALVAARMRCKPLEEFDEALSVHTHNVHKAFVRVFANEHVIENQSGVRELDGARSFVHRPDRSDAAGHEQHAISSVEKLTASPVDADRFELIHRVSTASPRFAQLLSSRPSLAELLREPAENGPARDYVSEFRSEVGIDDEPAAILAALRTVWVRLLLEIAVADIYQVISVEEVRALQTLLAEASIQTAMRAAVREVSRKYQFGFPEPCILALGKLGSGTLDYDSDLDLMLVYLDGESPAGSISLAEANSRAVELFITFLSAMTRDGHLYRVDLRLRPHGKNGSNVTTSQALIDYIKNASSVWELLAYVQMRAVGLAEEGVSVENAAREAIRRRIEREDPAELKRETRLMRMRLEEQHGRSGRDVNIKFSSGGLLDVYFVTRSLHLLNPEVVSADARSTSAKLAAFHQAGILGTDDFNALRSGHQFLSTLDHAIRLIIGRTSRLPRANQAALEQIAARLRMGSPEDLNQQLSIHRINIRTAFDHILGHSA